MVRRPRERTDVRRLPDKQVRDREVLDAVLDAALVVHVAVVQDDGQPFVLPLGCARDGDRLLVHGSTASRAFRRLSAGAPTCATVTLLDRNVEVIGRLIEQQHVRLGKEKANEAKSILLTAGKFFSFERPGCAIEPQPLQD